MIKLLLIATIIVVVAVIYLAYSLYIASRVVAPQRSTVTVSPDTISPHYENITVTTTDGVALKGWLLHSDTPQQKLIIFVHGIKNNRADINYGTTMIAKELLAKGYDVLLYDARAQGESGGNRITQGIKESDDLVQVVTFTKQKGYLPSHIGIIGDSFGAITLLLASPRLQEVGALVADSGASVYKPILSYILTKENGVPSFLLPGTYLMMKLAYGIDINKVRPVDSVAQVQSRIFLFLHGEADTTIPIKNSEELLAAANKNSRLIRFPGAKHVQTYKTDPQLYRNSVYSFLDQSLK